MKNYAAASEEIRNSQLAAPANDDVQEPIIEVCFWQSIIKLWLRFQSNIQEHRHRTADGSSLISFLLRQ